MIHERSHTGERPSEKQREATPRTCMLHAYAYNRRSAQRQLLPQAIWSATCASTPANGYSAGEKPFVCRIASRNSPPSGRSTCACTPRRRTIRLHEADMRCLIYPVVVWNSTCGRTRVEKPSPVQWLRCICIIHHKWPIESASEYPYWWKPVRLSDRQQSFSNIYRVDGTYDLWTHCEETRHCWNTISTTRFDSTVLSLIFVLYYHWVSMHSLK